jgi:CDP-L-myo-inositol myo-inositolphosphotransferase
MPETNDGIIARTINRRISRHITTFLITKYPTVTPNQISLVTFGIGLIGALCYPLHTPLIAGILLQTSSILDGCDGEIARALNQESSFGGFFDSVLDRYIDIAAITGITLFLLHATPVAFLPYLLLLCFLALAGTVMVSYTAAVGRAHALAFPRSIQSRDTRLFVVFLGSIIAQFYLPALLVVLFYLAVIGNFAVIFRLRTAKNHLS